MKKYFFMLLFIMIVGFTAACGKNDTQSSEDTGEAQSAEQFELRLATVVSEPHPWLDAAEYFKEEVEKQTDGIVTISIHHSGSLGDDETTIDEMRLGTVDFVLGGTQNAASFIPQLQIFGLAYLFEDMDHFEKAIDDESELFTYFENEFEEKALDIKLLALSGGGTRYLSNNKREIKNPEDLKGLKMRLPGSPIENDIWSALGALPSSLSWNEVYSGIQTGVVEGFESTLSGYTGSKLYEVAPYVSLTEHLYMATHFTMSEITYNKLPEEYQKTIDEVAKEAAKIGTEKGKEFDEELFKELEDRDVTISEVEREKFIDILEPLHDELAKELEAEELVDIIRNLQ